MRTGRHLLLSSVLTVLVVTLSHTSLAHGQAPVGNTSPLSTSPGNMLAKTVGDAQPDKEGRILVSDFRVADGSSKSEGVTLVSPYVEPDPREVLRDPTLRDRVEVHITSEVVTRLKNLGVSDVTEHFKGKTLRVRGKRTGVFYLGFPAALVHTVTVDRLDDILVTGTTAR
ncbi:MAG: hypothetical protein H7145_14430 [Akkermansiaceae bacterium]|nr:hypothetical protein [Armatimonadota bacterium]